MLPDVVEVTTAESYLNRLWSKDKLATRWVDFVEGTARWLKRRQSDRLEEDAEALARRDSRADYWNSRRSLAL